MLQTIERAKLPRTRPARAGLIPRLAAIVVVLLAAGAGLPERVAAADQLVRITDRLEPAAVELTPGTVVRWVNESGNRHRMRTTSAPVGFDSGNLEPGDSFSVTLTTVGVYDYADDRDRDNPAFHGRIVVSEQTPIGSAPPGDPGATPPPAAPPTSGDVGMAGRAFRPATIAIATGGSVTWRNDDTRDHTATSSSGGFDSGTMQPGATYTRTFPTAGTYTYLCLIHPDMTGAVVVSAPGQTAPPPPPPPPPTPAPVPAPLVASAPGSVRIVDYSYTPATLSVPVGTRVSWVNAGRAPHTVTAVDGSFDSGMLASGQGWASTFRSPGTFRYLCSIHPEMVGQLRVTDASGAAPPAAATAPPSTAGPSSPPGDTGELVIADFTFEPASVTVPAETTLRWVNRGLAPHTVTDRAGGFDSGVLETGEGWAWTFREAGRYAIYCVIHPAMVGEVVVTAAVARGGAGGALPVPVDEPRATGGPARPDPTDAGSLTLATSSGSPASPTPGDLARILAVLSIPIVAAALFARVVVDIARRGAAASAVDR